MYNFLFVRGTIELQSYYFLIILLFIGVLVFSIVTFVLLSLIKRLLYESMSS